MSLSQNPDALRDFLEASRDEGKIKACWPAHEKEYPAGSLNLPPLLDARRLEYRIAAGAFMYTPMWDYVKVMQLEFDPSHETMIAGSTIVRPAAHSAAHKRMSYVGILVGAGLGALDRLRSEGVDLGHIVRFVRHTVAQTKVDELRTPEGRPVEFFTVDLHVGDIRESMDLAEALREGRCKRDVVEHEDGRREHVFVDEAGKVWRPDFPEVGDNF